MLSAGVIVVALRSENRGDVEAWAAVAAALAILASVISSWSAQRVLELQEDQTKPFPYPAIDAASRYGLLQLRVTNRVGGPAYDISFHWQKPLLKASGEPVAFSGGLEGGHIAVLGPGESIATLIDGNIEFFAKYTPSEADYSGTLTFRDASGRRYSHQFRVNAGQFAGTLVHSEEALRTHFELQRLPEQFDRLKTELRGVRDAIDRAAKARDHGRDSGQRRIDSAVWNSLLTIVRLPMAHFERTRRAASRMYFR